MCVRVISQREGRGGRAKWEEEDVEEKEEHLEEEEEYVEEGEEKEEDVEERELDKDEIFKGNFTWKRKMKYVKE